MMTMDIEDRLEDLTLNKLVKGVGCVLMLPVVLLALVPVTVFLGVALLYAGLEAVFNYFEKKRG